MNRIVWRDVPANDIALIIDTVRFGDGSPREINCGKCRGREIFEESMGA